MNGKIVEKLTNVFYKTVEGFIDVVLPGILIIAAFLSGIAAVVILIALMMSGIWWPMVVVFVIVILTASYLCGS